MTTGTGGWAAASRYVLGESIGRGGSGEVFRAQDTQLHRLVAVKRLHSGNAQTGNVVQEARNLAALQHPNIVTIHDFIEEGGELLVVMELLHGRTLQDIAEQAPLTTEDFLSAMSQTLEGLIAAHSIEMLHRDIKPSNLMFVDRPGGGFQVKILDFGLAKVAPESSRQTTDLAGSVFGSVFTMSPEQFGGQVLDARSDLYALGCTAYFALTTRYPFTGATVPEVITAHLRPNIQPLAQLRPDMPEDVNWWVMRLLAMDPADRPASAVAALEDLRATVPRPASRKLPPPAAASLRRAPLLLVAGIVMAAVAVFWMAQKPRPVLGAAPPAGEPPAAAPVAPVAPVVAATIEAPAVAILPEDRPAFLARNGQEVTVEGLIERVGINKKGTIHYLNFEGTHPGDISLVFFIKDAPGLFTEEGLSRYIGRRLRATGRVSLYDGNPQIIIKSLDQLQTL